MKKEKKGNLKLFLRLALIAVICLVLFVVLSYIFSLTGLDQLSEEEIQQIISACGAWAPIVYIIVTFLQVTFIPIPFVVTILAGNLLFGFWGSFFYSLIGTVMGSVFAFILGKRIGRPFVNWAFGDAEAVERYLSQAKGKEFVVFFFMFLLPFFPDDALCALAGITDLSNRQFAFILAISRPITVLGNLILWTGEVIPYNGWGILLMLLAIAITAASFLLSMKYADRITELFDLFTDKLAVLLRRKKEQIIEQIHDKVVAHHTAKDGSENESAPDSSSYLSIDATPRVPSVDFPEELRLHPSTAVTEPHVLYAVDPEPPSTALPQTSAPSPSEALTAEEPTSAFPSPSTAPFEEPAEEPTTSDEDAFLAPSMNS